MNPLPSEALKDITVVDLTRVRSGPTCVRQLADWGANVVKVEMPVNEDSKDPTDFSGRHDPDFQNLHRNKRSLSLDLKKPEGKTILKRLVERADVVVENFRPDVTERLGIDYNTLAKINPRLVYASISGFGPDGPYKDRPGVDQIAQGLSGLMSITGEPGRGPMRVGIALADLSAGLFAALGIMVALHERNRSGKGQWVQTSLLQAQIFMLDFQGARYAMKGEIPRQVGNNHPTGTPTGTFATRDGYVNIAPTPAMWRRFCRAIAREDLADHPDYSTPADRTAHRAALNAVIEAITAKSTTAELIELLNGAGIPCGPIYSLDQTFADPQVRHMKVTQTLSSEELGDVTLLAQPFSLSRTGSTLRTTAPECGQHNDEILAELGYTRDEIAILRKQAVI